MFFITIQVGSTGAVGSAAALKAHQEGAKISLALRDPSKLIPSLNGIPAKRVQADLTKPESVKDAVQQTGAKAAFIYAVLGTPDHMRSSIEALKESGIEYVVLLSSFSFNSSPAKGNARTVPPSDITPWIHAQVEISLEDVFGKDSFATVRPASFSSNLLVMKDGIMKPNPEVRHANPEAEFDWIATQDIGEVVGVLLAHSNTGQIVGLVGPEMLSIKDALSYVGGVLGKDIKVTTVSKEEAVDGLTQRGMPPPFAQWLTDNLVDTPGAYFQSPDYQEAAGDIEKFIQRNPTRFEQWFVENKHILESRSR